MSKIIKAVANLPNVLTAHGEVVPGVDRSEVIALIRQHEAEGAGQREVPLAKGSEAITEAYLELLGEIDEDDANRLAKACAEAWGLKCK